MQTVLGFVFRVAAFAAGLVFAASLVVAFVLLVVLWAVRAGWGRLTGRPMAPFAVRFRAAEGFRRAYRPKGPRARVV